MKQLIGLLLIVITLFFPIPGNAAPLQCSEEAVKQADKLLRFHFGDDNRIEIDKKVKALPPVKNPAGKEQKFLVLEVWGYIYKGQYRMRFIYYPAGKDCVLMGQEILEYARL